KGGEFVSPPFFYGFFSVALKDCAGRRMLSPGKVMLSSVKRGDFAIAQGRWLILSAAFLWSLAGVFIKFLDRPPLTIVFYRSLFAALVFTPFLRRGGRRPRAPIAMSALTYTAAISSFVAANAIVLQYTAPIFVFLFSRLVLREKIARLNGVALAVSMAGVAVIALDSAGRPEMAGVLLALLSGLLFAAYMINLRRTAAVDPVFLTWINNISCALLLLPAVRSDLGVSAT